MTRPSGRAGRAPAHETATVRVDRLALGGEAVGRLEGGEVVFVGRAAPGELVEVAIDRAARPARGRLLRVVEPSSQRVVPVCPFVEECGGCDWMHIDVSAQAAAHAELVRDAITHAMQGIASARLPEIRVHVAPRALGYRTRARLFVKAKGSDVRVGYRAAARRDLVAIDECAVLDASIARVIGDLGEVMVGSFGEGDVQVARGVIPVSRPPGPRADSTGPRPVSRPPGPRADSTGPRPVSRPPGPRADSTGPRPVSRPPACLPVLEIQWRGELASEVWSRVDARVMEGSWAGARIALQGAAEPARFGDPRIGMEGADGELLVVAPGSFTQPSDAGAVALARRVDELAEAAGKHVVELFAGSGTLSVLLARESASFTAVELAEPSAACARENLAARGIRGKVVVLDADAFAIPPRTELCVLDPPRTGAAGAVRAIAGSRARRLVYVSCDPATLARDLKVLVGAGFEVTVIETFELFPQTSHVETVVRLDRARLSRR